MRHNAVNLDDGRPVNVEECCSSPSSSLLTTPACLPGRLWMRCPQLRLLQ